MNTLKRLYVSIKSQIDHIADDFENHEALAGAAIKDCQEIARKTRLHLHLLGNICKQYQQKLQEQQEQVQLWSQRAVNMRQQDEQTALQCVKRMRQAQRQIKTLEQQLDESTAQEAKIRNDLETVQARLLAMTNKKHILAARQNRTEINEAIGNADNDPLSEAQSVFDRWESAVVSEEFCVTEPSDSDPLTERFEQEEDEQALQQMLDELTRTSANKQ